MTSEEFLKKIVNLLSTYLYLSTTMAKLIKELNESNISLELCDKVVDSIVTVYRATKYIPSNVKVNNKTLPDGNSEKEVIVSYPSVERNDALYLVFNDNGLIKILNKI